MQPLFASSAYTVPFWLPTNTRPPATVGCDHATDASGNPNDHFNASFGRSAAPRPASAAVCTLVLVAAGLQPAQRGRRARAAGTWSATPQRPVSAPRTSPAIVLPVRYSATARRSEPDSRAPCVRIAPLTRLSTIDCGD